MTKMDATHAQANFNDNLTRLGGLKTHATDPQAYNSNVGMASLCKAVAGLYDELHAIKQELAALKRKP
jgi:hypothetical protein